jgi:hypothetical protein
MSDLLLEHLWCLGEELEPETIDVIAKRNRAMNGPYSTDMWTRVQLLDELERGGHPLELEDVVVSKAVENSASITLDTRITLKQLLDRAGTPALVKAYREFKEGA